MFHAQQSEETKVCRVELARLRHMTVAELRKEYARVLLLERSHGRFGIDSFQARGHPMIRKSAMLTRIEHGILSAIMRL